MQSLAHINPHYAARLAGFSAPAPAGNDNRRREPPPQYARLPQAPVTGSPVPRLTSLYHWADPGPYGDRRYPGNCPGNLIKDLLLYFRPATVYDPMTGSGTCRDVCNELGVYCYSRDIHQGFDACERHFTDTFAFCWLHPPYGRQKLYAFDPKDLSREPTLEGFLARYRQLLESCAAAVLPGGQLCVLMGDYSDREWGFTPLVHHTKAIAFDIGLVQQHTDIIRFSHGASSGRKSYRSSFIPGLHDVCMIFTKPKGE